MLEKLTEYFTSIQSKFYIIGATARDIIMDIHGIRSSRATHDLDIAVAVVDWEKYQQIENGILNLEGFKKDKKQKQRFIFRGLYFLDMVPFGDIMKSDDKIFWPPEEEIAMSVLGFSEIYNSTNEIVVDDKLILNIASLAGIFILKVVAWNDRHSISNKDADDIAFIILNYFSISEDRIVEEHYDLYDYDGFTINTAGSRLLGRDIAIILKDYPSTKQKLLNILNAEINLKEESKLINQILETNRIFKFEETLKCLRNLVYGLHDNNI